MTKVKRLDKIREIPIEEIDGFPDHPYKVRDDEDAAIIFMCDSNLHRTTILPSEKAFAYYEKFRKDQNRSDI